MKFKMLCWKACPIPLMMHGKLSKVCLRTYQVNAELEWYLELRILPIDNAKGGLNAKVELFLNIEVILKILKELGKKSKNLFSSERNSKNG